MLFFLSMLNIIAGFISLNLIKARLIKQNLCFSDTDGKVILWDYFSGSIVKEATENRQVLGSEYHPKLSKFLTVGDDAKIFLYDEETMKVERVFEKG